MLKGGKVEMKDIYTEKCNEITERLQSSMVKYFSEGLGDPMDFLYFYPDSQRYWAGMQTASSTWPTPGAFSISG
ncbi:MAG: hypothetical protein ACPGGK_02905 [Pikeienuella sp.]